MAGRERRYVLDTNIFIRAARDARFNQELVQFHAAFAPFELLAAVVVQELTAGVRGASAKTLERALLDPFERRGRIVVPSYSAWKETGRALATLVSKGMHSAEFSRSFVNDVLLAMSCREAGVVLITENIHDFSRIAQVRRFDFVAPWPVPAA